MSKWIDFSIDERKAMIQGVVEAKNIDEAAAEKDWWVTAILYALFHTKASEYLLFKGGTSLSKGWDIIDRFSEDIDLALGRDFFLNEMNLSCANCTSNTQIHKFREKAQDYLFGEFKDDSWARDVYKRQLYNSDAPYAIPTVKIEISVLSMAEPYEMKRISSLVEQVYKNEDVDSDIVQTIKTVSPARTFLEKAFLLCEEYQKKEPRTYRMSRHFYDLEKLSHTDYMDKALNDSNLYYDIVEHRKKFYHVGYVDYDKGLPESITIVPSEELVPKYEVDYSDMRSSFIYGEALEFADLLKFLETLQERFRKVPPRATAE